MQTLFTTEQARNMLTHSALSTNTIVDADIRWDVRDVDELPRPTSHDSTHEIPLICPDTAESLWVWLPLSQFGKRKGAVRGKEQLFKLLFLTTLGAPGFINILRASVCVNILMAPIFRNVLRSQSV